MRSTKAASSVSASAEQHFIFNEGCSSMSGSQRRQEQEQEKKDHGGTGLTEGAGVSGLVPATQLPHDGSGDIYAVGNFYQACLMSRSMKVPIGVSVGACKGSSLVMAQSLAKMLNAQVGSGTQPPSAERAEVPTCARIGERIRMHRTGQGLSLRDVADRAGLSHAYLSELENDAADAKKPSVDVVERVAHALGVSPSYLAGWTVGSGNQPTSAERAVDRAGALAPKDSSDLTSQTPSGSVDAREVEARFAELISTELEHYAQKIAKRVLRKALGGKIAEREQC